MARIYSKTGCNRCKARRKKCDEVRPVCSACTKWGWSCSYDARQPRSRPPVVVALEVSTQNLDLSSRNPVAVTEHFDDVIENKVLKTIPDLIMTFFSPTSEGRTRDLQVMWQLMMSNDLLRNACVACFSAVMRHTTALIEKSQVTYGKALQSLRSSISRTNSNSENLICIIAAVVFLGKMESFAPNSLADPLQHWMALITLLGNEQVPYICHRILPPGESMLILESLTYHVGTHAIFSRATQRVRQLWQSNKICQLICDLNPDSPGRFNRSPLLCGQYALYNMALEVTYLLQSHPDDHIPPSVLDDMEMFLRNKALGMDDEFTAAVTQATNLSKHNAECAIYRLFCNSLLICVTLLREPSESQRAEMNRLVDWGMKLFLDLPSYGDDPYLCEHANHFMLAATWPIEIQGCAAYDMEQFQTFMHHYNILENFMDAGHLGQARVLFRQVRANLDVQRVDENAQVSARFKDKVLPVGLKLLRHPIVPPGCKIKLSAL